MVKLSNIISEIKIIPNATPEMIMNIWQNEVLNIDDSNAKYDRIIIRRKYSPYGHFLTTVRNKELSQSQLNNLYRDILDYLKKYNVE